MVLLPAPLEWPSRVQERAAGSSPTLAGCSKAVRAPFQQRSLPLAAVVLEVLERNVRQGSEVYEAGHVVVLAWCIAGEGLHCSAATAWRGLGGSH